MSETFFPANLLYGAEETKPNKKVNNTGKMAKTHTTRMWANAQRDGRPAEYRWRPLFNAA